MTYQIHRYPAELIDVVRLADGERVVIRPVLPQDEDLTTAFFRNLSAPARYDRFMTSMRELPPELMRRFTQIDYADHLALVAEVFAGRARDRDRRGALRAQARFAGRRVRRVGGRAPGRARSSRACCSASSPAARLRPACAASSARRWQPTPR